MGYFDWVSDQLWFVTFAKRIRVPGNDKVRFLAAIGNGEVKL
jgi:hypothetical protein